jgi:hypothetical protein
MSSPVADFDSASAMLRVLSRCLDGRDFEGMGIMGRPTRLLARAVNVLPPALRAVVYAWSGWGQAIPARRLRDLRGDDLAEWVVGHYSRPRYPGLAIGSSNGGAVHLCAALGIPWLPQTLLVPVRRGGVAPGDAVRDLEWGREAAWPLLRNNPDLQLHHVHDPNQDELMIRHMTYFRLKRRSLGTAYREFLGRLERGAPILLVECGQRWPVTRVGERHVFQCGAVGGMPASAYRGGGPDGTWRCPEPDAEAPEAEWGFERELAEDVARFADERGHPICRIVFERPEQLSLSVAELHRWWYRLNRLPVDRLLVETFILLEPFHARRGGWVPLWLTFNTEPDARTLEAHLDHADYDEIALTLFSHGADSLGLAPVDRWQRLLARARVRGWLAGADPKAFPRDFGTYARYSRSLARAGARWTAPSLTVGELMAYTGEQREGATPVRWEWSHESGAARREDR